ncbi:aminoglycoside phosphotransferase family protein [Kitasatospora sp. NPDC088779]|uniref:aminoglycoside phosphotransferase family protein n=1 Tax=Kitasatospora sp. NPDC088779 TaxID=3154964 RepID=UPI003443026F
MTTLPAATARLAGPAEVVSDLGWPGTTATVLLLRRPSGQHLVLKGNSSADCYARELHALRTWAPALDGAAPQLVDADEDHGLLLMTALPGTPFDEAGLTPDQTREAYWQAGALLRRLHQAGPAGTLATFGVDRAAYLHTQLSGATDPLTREELAFALAALDQLRALPPQPSQPSHLDLTARNLLAHTDETGALRVGLIDFETSRYEAAGRDFLRVTQRTLRTRADLADAFYRGYGRAPTAPERHLMHWCGIGDAAAIAVSAKASGHEEFSREAHAHLRAAMDLPGPPLI